MQYKIYPLIFLFVTYGLQHVRSLIGHNISPVNETEFRAVACIARYDPDGTWQHNMLCTGFLIRYDIIMTASHCFDEADHYRFEVSMGSHLVDEGQRYYPVWWIDWDQWAARTLHYQNPHLTNDILLFKIFGVWQDIPPIPVISIEPEELMNGLDVVVVGCGKVDDGMFPQTLQKGNVKVVDRRVCSDIVSSILNQEYFIRRKFTCTRGNPYTQIDDGDSGGPLVYFGNVIGLNIAVCPSLNDGFHPNKMNLHLNFQKYKAFINELAGTHL